MIEVTQAAKDAAAQFLCRDDGDFPELAALFQTYGDHVAAAAHATIHQLGENAAKAAGEYAEEVRQERLAVGAYLKHAADEAYGLAGKAQSDGAIAMFRAIGNSITALGKTIESGAHEAYRAALTEPTDDH